MLLSRCRPKGKIGFCFVETWLHILQFSPGCKWLQCLFLSWIKEMHYLLIVIFQNNLQNLKKQWWFGGYSYIGDVQLWYCVNKRAAFEADDRRSESLACSFSFSGCSLAFSPSWTRESNAEENLKGALISPSWGTQFLPVDISFFHTFKSIN